jgi:hypothetical protein
MRLSPDMFNLTRQVRAATDHAANAAGRLASKELLKFANDETSIAQLKDRIAKTIDYLKSVKQSAQRTALVVSLLNDQQKRSSVYRTRSATCGRHRRRASVMPRILARVAWR